MIVIVNLLYCLLDLSCGEYYVISLYVMCCSVDGSFLFMCSRVACWTMLVNCLVKQFAICLDVVVILLLDLMELLSVGRGGLLDIPCIIFQRICVLCLLSQCASKCSFNRVS